MSNDNSSKELPATNEIGYRTLKSLLRSGVSGQAQHNAYAQAQNDREARVRSNLDKLESMKQAQSE